MRNNKSPVSWAANECPKIRWISALFVGLALGFAGRLIIPMIFYFLIPTEISCTAVFVFFQNMTIYAWMFWCLTISIRLFTKTSIKAFILGSTESVNRPLVKRIAFLFITGFLLSTLPILKYIQRSDLSFSQFALCAVISLLFLWMQTAFEEFLFRGIVIRICYGDRPVLKKNIKTISVVVVTALAFMAAHTSNPEIQSLSGAEQIFMLGTYFISGVVFAITDLYFGSLMPGIVLHWLNNIMCFVFLTDAVSVGGTTSLFVNTRSIPIGSMSLVREIILFIPLLVFLILDVRRKKQKISKEKCN